MIYGAKKGSKGQQKPNIAKDTTASTNYFQGLYGLSEGEVFGLVDGGKSIKLDGTPLINDNGQPNFQNVSWEFRNGTVDQEHIKGFSSVENEQSVGVELRHDRPFTRAISNTQLSAVVIRLNWGALREQKDNGDIVGYKIDYAIDVQTDGGAWATVLNTTINDKASQGYQRSHRIDLPTARRGWTVRVRRITPNRDSDLIADTMSVQAITEVIDAKLRYPCTSLLALKYDAETFGNVAKVAVRMRGMIVQVPSNYNAQTRTYTGVWDGTFKPAYTNNPAWVFYDLCTAKRYGLGERLAGKVDKWSLYALGQYCDEMVDDGKGGKEPRFTVNVYIQKAQDAYQILQSLASVFRAMSYWDGVQIIVDADTPKEPVYTFTNANVVNGAFSYTGTRKRDRHSIAKVAYDDPDNEFKTDYVHVRDEFAIAKYGISIIDINAFGCTSRSQAYRAGAWALQSEQLETETVTFSAGLDGFIPKVGEVINVSDNARAGRANGGRVVSASGRTVTLDRAAGKVGDTFVINGTDGQAKTAKITAIRGAVITLNKVIGAVAGAVWAMTSSDLAPRQFRVMSIKQNDDNTFGITGLQYEPSKFSASDNGARAIARPVSVIKPQVLDTPSNIIITGHNRVVQGQNVTTLTINWAQVVGAVGYIVEWRKDDNAWQALPTIASQSVDIDGVYSGNYQARVRAVDAFDNQSLIGFSDITRIEGKQGKPTKLASLTADGVLFGMSLAWQFGRGSDDTAYTEIELSPDGRSNIAVLGTFAYPTNKHEIQGLQGNLTQFYRGRIVDKLGNTSDWTDWVSGTTSADASEILENLSTQIVETELDRVLTGKISGINERIDDIDVNSQNNKEVIARLPRSVDVEYYLSNSVNSPVGGSWTTTAPRWIDGKYMWSRTKLTLENGDIQYKPSINGVCIAGATGATGARGADGINGRDGAQGLPGRNGADGRGVQSVSEEYYLSSSSSRLLGGSWQSTNPTWSVGKYIWTRSKVVYTDGRIEYSEPHVSSEWQGVYDIANTAKTQVDLLAPTVTELDKAVGKYGRIRGVVIDNNGVMTGYALMSDIENGHVVSRFGINADNFYIGNPANNKKPFIVNTRPTTINGVRYPAGVFIDSAYIAQASIKGAHIEDGAITNAKIGNGAIKNANIENGAINNAKIENGAITTAKIGTAQVDTLQIAGEAVIVPRAAYDDTPRSNYTGELLNISLESQGAPTVINASIDITSVSRAYSGKEVTFEYVTAELDRSYRVILKANNEVIANRKYRVQHYKTERTNSVNKIYATSYNKQLEISNLLHTPKNSLPQTYTLEIAHESGLGTHTINSVSILAMAVKR